MKFKNTHLDAHQIVRMTSRGEIALPAFQRDFVWSPNNVIELIESVSNGWPVGALLLLEGPQVFATKPINGVNPRLNPKNAQYYLLDGQQRVTALFQVLDDSGDTVYYIDLSDDSDSLDENGYPRVRWTKRGTVAGRPREDSIWTVAQLLHPEDDERFGHMPPNQRRRLLDIRQHILGDLVGEDYSLPAIVMRSDIDLETLTRIFETLNRTGTRLDAFDLMVAIVYNETVGGEHVDLRSWWDDAVSENQILGGIRVEGLNPKPIEILKLIALWQRRQERQGKYKRPVARMVTGVRQSDVLNVPSKQVVKMWSSAVSSYVDALEWLKWNGGIVDSRGVPSWAMVLTLADSLSQEYSQNNINRWYWTSIATQSYAQGANTRVTSDVDRQLRLNEEINVEDVLRSGLNDDSKRNRILRVGYRGLLGKMSAQDPVSGKELNPRTMVPFVIREHGGLSSHVEPTDVIARIVYCEPDSLKLIASGQNASFVDLDLKSLNSQGIGSGYGTKAVVDSRAEFFLSAVWGGQ